jgi:hypothetical protein
MILIISRSLGCGADGGAAREDHPTELIQHTTGHHLHAPHEVPGKMRTASSVQLTDNVSDPWLDCYYHHHHHHHRHRHLRQYAAGVGAQGGAGRHPELVQPWLIMEDPNDRFIRLMAKANDLDIREVIRRSLPAPVRGRCWGPGRGRPTRRACAAGGRPDSPDPPTAAKAPPPSGARLSINKERGMNDCR